MCVNLELQTTKVILHNSKNEQISFSNPISIFDPVVYALTHLCDHVLSHVESSIWTLLSSNLKTIIQSEETRREFAKGIWADATPEGLQGKVQELYNEYAAAIDLSIGEGGRSGWWDQVVFQHNNEQQTDWRVMGLSGVYVVFDGNRVITAMLPLPGAGPGDNAHVDRQANPLPRHQTPNPPESACIQFNDDHENDENLNPYYQRFKANLVRFKQQMAARHARCHCEPVNRIGEIPPFGSWRFLWRERKNQEAV